MLVGTIYHLDDLDMSLGHSPIDVYALPPKVLADVLIAHYFSVIHIVFPIVDQQSFVEQYDAVYKAGNGATVSKTWLAGLNIIFALGELHENMTAFISSENSKLWHHGTFFIRARILGALDGGYLFEIATLQSVQTLGLTGFYLLASKQTNRYLYFFWMLSLYTLLRFVDIPCPLAAISASPAP